jgi:hypothetical protein
MNSDLRNSLWNFISNVFEHSTARAVEHIGKYFFKVPGHQIPLTTEYRAERWFWERYETLEWYLVYDLLEFVSEHCEYLSTELRKHDFESLINTILTQEVSGYRFVQGSLSPITAETEIEAINQALSGASVVGLDGVHAHIESAVRLLGQKPEPDYRNSIKESISAVESAVKSISGVSGGGLDAALKELVKHAPIHKALQEGFLNLYGYSSDEKGIRHALLEESKSGFDEAKFMVVACSAVVNFLISKAGEAGLLKK